MKTKSMAETNKKIIISIRHGQTIGGHELFIIPVDPPFLEEMKEAIIAGYRLRQTEVEFQQHV